MLSKTNISIANHCAFILKGSQKMFRVVEQSFFLLFFESIFYFEYLKKNFGRLDVLPKQQLIYKLHFF